MRYFHRNRHASDQLSGASASGFAADSLTTAIPNGATITRDFSLAKFGLIDGVVSDLHGTPIHGATVTSGPVSVSTNSVGRYALTMLPPGQYGLTVVARGFSTGHFVVTVTEGRPSTANLTLPPAVTGVIAGNVSDDDGPVNHATVSAQSIWSTVSANSDSDGNYTLAGLPVGQTQVSVTARHHQAQHSAAHEPKPFVVDTNKQPPITHIM